MLRDTLWALRWLRHNPLFTAVVLVTLALGIGANTAVFSVVDAVLLAPLPYQTPGRIVQIEELNSKQAASPIPSADYLRWRDRRDLFSQVAAFRFDSIVLTGIETPDQILCIRATSSLFSVLGVRAHLGRTLVASDDRPGSAQSLILSDKLFRRLFRADPGILGQSVRSGDDLLVLAGVMPPQFEFPDPGKEMWLPLRLTGEKGESGFTVVARLKKGVSLSQANAAMAILARQFEQEDPVNRAGLQIRVSPWHEDVGKKAQLTLVFILAAVGLLLLIACANVASLMLSRAVQRHKEIAIRACLGAGLWRVARQLLAESLVLAAAGSAAGIVLALALLRFLARHVAALPIFLPHVQQVGVTGRVLAFNAVVCLAVACIFSLAPVLAASRLDLQTSLRSGRSAGAARGSTRLFSVLIAAETGLAFLLLTGAGLMVRSLIRLQQADLGIHADHVLTMKVPVGGSITQRLGGTLATKPQQMAYFRKLVDRLQTIAGVRAAAIVNNLPLSPYNTTLSGNNWRARCISPRYFFVMGIPLLAGRNFADSDQATAPPVVILNERLAHQLFPDRDAVGQTYVDGGHSVTVVGVVRNSPQMAYDSPPEAEVYLPYQQFIFASFLAAIVVRTDGDPLALSAALQKEVWAINPDQPIVKVETMDDVIADSIWRPRFSAWVLSVISGLALLLMSAGVYGVIAYTVSLRSHEVGVRVALGATPRNVASVILRDTLVPVAIGLSLSVLAAFFLHRLLAGLLFGISGADPATYLTSAAALMTIGLLAGAGPAWKAANSDPLNALRSE